jgi:plastocyanin
MGRKFIALAVALVGLAVSACGGRMTGSNIASPAGGTYVLPPLDSDLVMVAVLPKDTIGEERPDEGLGSIKSGKWKAVLGGYTQQRYSQSLGFPPGTKITIRNLSHNTEHTLDVVRVIDGPPAVFPKNPKLSIPARGKGRLEAGYASGPIKPGKSITVRLAKGGIYLIGCAFHYHQGMHDVLVVRPNAGPGQQATAPPTSRPTPTPRSSYDP